jgi:hypothetical protein
MQRPRVIRSEVFRMHRPMKTSTLRFLQMLKSDYPPSQDHWNKQSSTTELRKLQISHIKLGHTATASLSPAFIQNSAGETVRSKNREYAGFELSELTDKFTDIWGTKLDTSQASTEQCCYLQEYYELSTADVGTAITTQAHPPLPFVTAIFCHKS